MPAQECGEFRVGDAIAPLQGGLPVSANVDIQLETIQDSELVTLRVERDTELDTHAAVQVLTRAVLEDSSA